jgi:hypothetical protein
MRRLFLAAVLGAFLVSCGGSSTPKPGNETTKVSTAVVAQSTTMAFPSPTATATVIPTSVPTPATTPTPVPTPTPSPIPSPTPTPTPVPPTPTPTPVPPPQVTKLSGTGKQLTDPVQINEGLAIITLKHNGSSNFAVWLDGQATADHVDLLVNEIGSWQGSRATSIPESGKYLFEVDADGPWSIEISQPTPLNASVVGSPHDFSGTGTQALYFLKVGSGIHKVAATHNGSANFAVIAYSSDASSRQLLFNEIGAVNSSVALRIGSGGAYVVFDVEADGDWTLSVQ